MAPKLNLLSRFRRPSADDSTPLVVLADGPAWRNRRPWYDSAHLTAAVGVIVSLTATLAAQAGDILRGGASAGSKGGSAAGGTISAQAAAANANAKDALSRTTQAVQSVKAMQKAARDAATANNAGLNLPSVPNGLAPGGLQVAPGVPANLAAPTPGENAALWTGASLPTQSNAGGRTTVTVRQNKSQALLTWQTFNVGKETTLNFDQSAGGQRKNEWIAFNKVDDPSGRPSQILGNINADGQVYVINQNGILFGGASQINTRTFVASGLPINDNLVAQGLLNNRDAQFLFSALPVPGGADGTPAFNPTTTDPEFFVSAGADTYVFRETIALTSASAPQRPNTPVQAPSLSFKNSTGAATRLIAGTDYNLIVDTATRIATVAFTPDGLDKVDGAAVTASYAPAKARAGNVIVQPGATFASPVSADGNGGRLMFVGANVTNAGTLSSPAGQTILAAGLQVAVAAHASNDPSLRGLDVYVGAAEAGTGTVTNSGLIESLAGSVALHGREVNQLGAIESLTTVDLNGRIDLKASYGAVGNPVFDNVGTGAGAPPFFYQETGVITLGPSSVTRILPDYTSDRTVPGTALPQRSQINLEGSAIYLAEKSLLFAPNGLVSIRAGVWPYKDGDGNRTTLSLADTVETGLQNYYANGAQRFLSQGGQIYIAPGALLSVAGTPDVPVELSQSIVDVEFRGSELADSPLQRNGPLRAVKLTLDLRQTGVLNGRYWIGTPLGDATGVAGLIQRNAAQLTADGGSVTLQAGGSIVVQKGATIDVSGGYFQHEGGMVKTTRLLQQGRLVDISNALPDQAYDGIYTGQYVVPHAKYGLFETFTTPFLGTSRYEPAYITAAKGGSLNMTAPAMAIDGELRGNTIDSDRDRSAAPAYSSLSLNFSSQRLFTQPGDSTIQFLNHSLTPPAIVFQRGTAQGSQVPDFQAIDGQAPALPQDRSSKLTLSTDLLEKEASGFGILTIANPSGSITIPSEVELAAQPSGSIMLAASNIQVAGKVFAPGGTLTLTAYNRSPDEAVFYRAEHPAASFAIPLALTDRGVVTLGPNGRLNTAGLIIDDRMALDGEPFQPLVIAGGKISIEAYSADLASGGVIDVSGGASASLSGALTYGAGGSLSIKTGRDPGFANDDVLGGTLSLGATLLGYSGVKGASLALQAGVVQVGGVASTAHTVLLKPRFFQQGGFTRYDIAGFGALATDSTSPTPNYIPGINIAHGTLIEPTAESWIAQWGPQGTGRLALAPAFKPVELRSPTSISFTALGSDDTVFTPDLVEVRGDLVMGEGTKIAVEPGASISLKGQTVTLLGGIHAPGGVVTISGASKFPLGASDLQAATFARTTVYLGPQAQLSAAGTFVPASDAFGRRLGTVLSGGTISISGNIVAAAGSTLDVSGSSAVLDLHPSALGLTNSVAVMADSGINATPARLTTVPTIVSSNAGLIDLQGAEMLFSDATLLARAGGPTAVGGTLSIFSGRFYTAGTNRTSADINLVVTQAGTAIPTTNAQLGIGLPVLGENRAPLPGMGYFVVNSIAQAGFNSLDFGYKVVSGSPSFGGNVQFVGPVSINVPGSLRVAAGGVIQANASVKLSSAYLAIGQSLIAPHDPLVDPVLFQQQSSSAPYAFAPTFGSGNVTFQAGLIDVGTLSMQGIGKSILIANGGDIRGSGTLNISGDLELRAAQVYPTTLASFDIFAYDKNVVVTNSASGQRAVTLASSFLPEGFGVGSAFLGSTVQSIAGATVTLAAGANLTISTPTPVAVAPGSVTITGAGQAAAPLSAGGSLRIFASNITQGGTLRAPLGSITLGWDGTDLDPSDADLDTPFDLITRGTQGVPVTQSVSLKAGSMTSVSGIDRLTGEHLIIPFGLSPDGTSWIDPRGVNVTVSGLPQKKVTVAGNAVVTENGSTIDLAGGGDLLAYRWVQGAGGSIDLLGSASGSWDAATQYSAGDLVTDGGKTYSARVRNTGQKPSPSLYWTLVPESYAIVPGYSSSFAPIAPYNTTSNAGALGGDPGYVSGSLKVGDQIYLNATPELAAGYYTLLPRRYALLPGALLVTPLSTQPVGTVSLPTSASYTSGYAYNVFRRAATDTPVRSLFEVASAAVVQSRVAYDLYLGNRFFTESAISSNLTETQLLPMDAGYVALRGNTILRPQGNILTERLPGGRGAWADLSSAADIYITGGSGTAPVDATAVLDTSTLNAWGIESLLIGGTRRVTDTGTIVDVRTSKIVVDNRGGVLAGPDLTLVSRGELTVTGGSSVAASGQISTPSSTYLITGDGTALRVNAQSAAIIRTGTTNATSPILNIGAGATVAGTNVILDSTYGTQIDPSATIAAANLSLGSGQISVLLEPTGTLTGSVVNPHLVIADQLLAKLQQFGALTLRSYSTIDFYGAGTFGNSTQFLSLAGGGIRGYNQGAGNVTLQAGELLLDNASNVTDLPAPAISSGALVASANRIRFGSNGFSVAGYSDAVFNATDGILGTGTGSLTVAGNLTLTTPAITGLQSSVHTVTASGALVMNAAPGTSSVEGGLGAAFNFVGATVLANSRILLPSGQISLRATTGDVTVGGTLDVEGKRRDFYDLIRFTDGGKITLKADAGNVRLEAASTISVAAPEGGGKAGTLAVSAAQGTFSSNGGGLDGHASAGRPSGSFLIDVATLASFADINATLNDGGFFQQRNFRIRTGDVIIGGTDNAARDFTVSTDTGNITLTGTIDASWRAGLTNEEAAAISIADRIGGKITLIAGRNLTLASGSILTTHAEVFDSAGKGGEIRLEAGAQLNAGFTGAADPNATLTMSTGSLIDLGVDAHRPGEYTDPQSSAFYGLFTGKLHLRAPRLGNDLNVSPIASTITGASSVVVEGYRVYQPAGGLMNNALRQQIDADASSYLSTANYAALESKFLSGSANPAALQKLLVIAPGVEIVNPTGDLSLGTPNNPTTGTATSLGSADWDLSQFRYGSKGSAGVLTLRASGNLIFNNTLSDGFTPIASTSATGNSSMWLATLMDLNPNLPVNTQSWSYRLSAGADLRAADFRSTVSGAGSIFVGEFYNPAPNTSTTGGSAAVGNNGLTANSIRISTTSADTGTRYEVIRTGTGDITLASGGDIELRNQFATIYTAGVRIPNPTTMFSENDFVPPITDLGIEPQPAQTTGANQHQYSPQWSMAGGNVVLAATGNIEHVTRFRNADTVDSSAQLPVNWLYRRGYVDSSTGLFGVGGVDGATGDVFVSDPAASTTWWIDFSNFFQGVGALGGGNVTLQAGQDVVNVDAVTPTNARMPGQTKNADGSFTAISPDASKLVELGGGDILIQAGRNIDGGVYYVERGQGTLFAGGEIKTNEGRTPSLGILSSTRPVGDPLTWLPTTLFAGKAAFDISARGNILLGPAANPFMLPSGQNNRFWYKTYFDTYSPEASVDVASFGGNVTLRLGTATTPILNTWLTQRNFFIASTASNGSGAYWQPWTRLAENRVADFTTLTGIMPPTLRTTAFAGDVNIAGKITLFPSATGTLELAASGGIIGIQPSGRSGALTTWTAATINVSDADPNLIPGITTPFAYQSQVGRVETNLRTTTAGFLNSFTQFFTETGGVNGNSVSAQVQRALHASSLLHDGDTQPVRLYATGGDITGLTLFSPKASRVIAQDDITDVAFYIQNVNPADITVISAGRDIVPSNANAPLRTLANNTSLNNLIATAALPGDIQISGPGVLEVLAGGNIDLGTGPNIADGTGVGITSIGSKRNPFLPDQGASIIALAGIGGPSGNGPAFSLGQSSLDFVTFGEAYLPEDSLSNSPYLATLDATSIDDLTEEQQAVVSLEGFFEILREAGRGAAIGGGYAPGFLAISDLFGTTSGGSGNIFTRARDIRTTSGGSIAVLAPSGGLTMASDIFGNPFTPPGIVTEFGGSVSTFTDGSVDIGQARIFTLRGGDIVMWSSNGNIAAGNAPKTVVTAPPTRVLIDTNSAAVQTDLGGLATGGGIGVLASVVGVPPGDVDLIAPSGFVDAGDAGIRSTGNLTIAAIAVLNAGNIQVAGNAAGVPSAPTVSAPNLGALASASNATNATNSTANQMAEKQRGAEPDLMPSIIVVEVVGFTGGE